MDSFPIDLQPFKTLKYYLKVMGILEIQLSSQYQKISISLIQRIIFSSFSFHAISTIFWFLITEATDSNEIVESFYVGSGHLLLFILYLLFLWRHKEIELIFKTFERKIQNRK